MHRSIRGQWAVARRCHLGIPMTIENHPRMPDGSPFPTLYWLTCPILLRRASTLESGGWMSVLSDRLKRDAPLRARLESALDRYRARRDRHERIEESGGPPGGGPERVKCLHAHLAHELAESGNPIGSLTLAETGFPDCAGPCVPQQ